MIFINHKSYGYDSLQGQNLVIGNVGDSIAIMGTRAIDNSITVIQLREDLKPNLPSITLTVCVPICVCMFNLCVDVCRVD